MDRKYLEFS